MGDLTHFFCKSHKLYISRWRILFLPSCIWCILPSNTCILRTYHEFPKMGVTVTYSNPHFRKFVNFRKWGLLIATLFFGNSWKPRKMDLFCSLKSVFGWYFFVFFSSEFILAGETCQKNSLDFVNLGPQSTVCNLNPHIGVRTESVKGDRYTQYKEKNMENTRSKISSK